jgi:hypothetical protein
MALVLGAGGGANRPSVSQQSNDGIGGGGPDGATKGILALAALLVVFFLFLYFFG